SLFPLIESTEICGDCLLDAAGRFAVASQSAEVFFVKNGGVGSNQFLHLQALYLEARGIVRQPRQHLLKLTDTALGACVVVMVVRNDQLFRKALQFFRVEGQWLDRPPAGRGRLSLQFGMQY